MMKNIQGILTPKAPVSEPVLTPKEKKESVKFDIPADKVITEKPEEATQADDIQAPQITKRAAKALGYEGEPVDPEREMQERRYSTPISGLIAPIESLSREDVKKLDEAFAEKEREFWKAVKRK